MVYLQRISNWLVIFLIVGATEGLAATSNKVAGSAPQGSHSDAQVLPSPLNLTFQTTPPLASPNQFPFLAITTLNLPVPPSWPTDEIVNRICSASGTLADTLFRDTTLVADLNPWLISRNLIIFENATLTIAAGAILHFNPNAGIKVNPDGRLVAIGTAEQRIVMTRAPGSTSSWNGIVFDHTLKENSLEYVDMSYGDQQNQSILVQYSRLLLDHMTWNTTSKIVVEALHPSLLIKNSEFPDVNNQEVIHGEYLRNNEYFILENNRFDRPSEYRDVIDFSDCRRPGPVLEVYNNTFTGGGDDGLDLDGCDAHVEGNTFLNFHKANTSTSTSNAIATGIFNNYSPTIVVARNLFLNNDHAVLLKEDSYLIAENNVFVNCTYGAINYSEWPDRTVDPGKGAYFDGNIFWNNGVTFQNQYAQPGHTNPEIVLNRCIVPLEFHLLGTGNIDVDPQFVDPESDFHLLTISPAIGTGPNGLDMGRYVPSGASIAGEPDSVTTVTMALLSIAGPGITHYQYSVNDPTDSWSSEFSVIDNPQIELTGLQADQSYTVYVRGKNSAGRWQTEPGYATSKTWKVESASRVTRNTLAAPPRSFVLHQNAPNPFNPTTVLEFELADSRMITLKVLDGLGKEVAEIASGYFPAGRYKSIWDARNSPSGIYYARFQAGDFTQTRKMMLIK